MALYGYKIGTSYAGLANVEALATPLPAPRSYFRPFAKSAIMGDLSVQGFGSPVATWSWGFVTTAQREMLRTFCTGLSADVFIRTPQSENSLTYEIYTAKMLWPAEEPENTAGRKVDFTISFINLVVYTP